MSPTVLGVNIRVFLVRSAISCSRLHPDSTQIRTETNFLAKFPLNKHIYPSEMDINRGADDQMLVLAAAAIAIDEEQLQSSCTS